MRLRTKGISLVGVLISCAIFSLIAIVLFSLLRQITNSWRSVEDRSVVQSQLQRLQSSVTEELRKTSFSSVVISKKDYRHAIAFETYADPDSGVFVTDTDGQPESQGYVLYFLMRPTDDPCEINNGNTGSGDSHCPHKTLIRVELTRNNDADLHGTATWEPVELNLPEDIEKYIPGNVNDKQFNSSFANIDEYKTLIAGDPKYVKRVNVVARNLVGFDIWKIEPPQNPEVKINIKGFKLLEAGPNVAIGSVELNDSIYTIEFENSVIPQNP